MNDNAEQALRELVEERIRAVKAKNTAVLADQLHPDIVMFNVLPPLHRRGKEDVLQQARAWFDGYASEIGYQVQDLRVTADENIGFCSFLYRVTGTLSAGGEVDMWVRATLCCRRIDEKWLVTHDHESVPFDPRTGQALTSLIP